MGYAPPPMPPDDPPGYTRLGGYPERPDPAIVPVSYRGGSGLDLPWWVLWAGFWTMVSVVMAVLMLLHAAGMDAR